jgi:hypothetical protein
MCENFYYTNPQSQLVGLETYMHAMGAFTIKGPTTHHLSAEKKLFILKIYVFFEKQNFKNIYIFFYTIMLRFMLKISYKHIIFKSFKSFYKIFYSLKPFGYNILKVVLDIFIY